MRCSGLLLLSAVVACPLVSCGPTAGSMRSQTNTSVSPDSNSGGDEAIGGARGLFDMVVNDSVDVAIGDNTDYKYFDIDERGSVTIRVRFQQVGLTGSLAIHNDYGDILHNQGISPDEQEIRVQDFDVLPGRYYASVTAREGRADYAIGREFTAAVAVVETPPDTTEWEPSTPDDDDDDGGSSSQTRRSDDDDDGGSSSQTRRSDDDDDDGSSSQTRRSDDDDDDDGSSSSSRTTDSDQTTSEGDGDTETDTEGTTDTETPETGPVRASIVNLRVRGSGTTLILRGCGSSSGLREGATGRAAGSRVTLTRITGSNSCEAESDASVGSLSSANSVSF